jgi:zinc protease
VPRWIAALAALFIFGLIPAAQAVDIERWETAQGMRVLYAPAPTLPMLDIRLTFDAGAARDGDRQGLARLTSSALAHGTADMNADAVAERFESVGAQFSTSSARDMGIVSLRTLTEPDWMAEAITVLTAILAAPGLPGRRPGPRAPADAAGPAAGAPGTRFRRQPALLPADVR